MKTKTEHKKIYKKKIAITSERSMPKYKAARLQKLRVLANLEREELASPDSGISLYSLRGWENARFGGMPLDGAKCVIKRVAKEGIECSLEWLAHGVGTAPKSLILEKNRKVFSIKNKLSEEKLKELLEKENSLIAEELECFRKQFKNTLDFKVEDDSLEPFYNPGEYVAGIECQKEYFDSLAGMDCIVATQDNKVYLRKLKPGSEENKFTLECTNLATNAETPNLYDVTILRAAPVLRIYKRNPGINYDSCD